MAGVDTRNPKNPLWTHRYKRLVPGFAYNDPVVVDGKVIVAAADAKDVVALDARTGAVAWTYRTRGVVAYVVGVSQGAVVLAGTKAVALELESGRVRWGPHKLGDLPYGRGFVGATYAHVPVRGARIERFELRTGKRARALEFQVKRLGNLLHVGGRLLVADGERIMCFTTAKAELARLGGKDPSRLLDRALVSAIHGDGADAHADFRRAWEGAVGFRQRDVCSLAVHHLLRLGRVDQAAWFANRFRGHTPSDATLLKAQVAFVRAKLKKGRAIDEFLARYGRTKVVHEGRVMIGTAAIARIR